MLGCLAMARRLPSSTRATTSSFLKSFIMGTYSRKGRSSSSSSALNAVAMNLTIGGSLHSSIALHLLPRDDHQTCAQVLEVVYTRAKHVGVVSLDTEWQPEKTSFMHNKVALVQLGIGNDVFLIQLLHMQRPVIEPLTRLLADPHIVKVGCSIKTDCKRLATDYGYETESVLDIRDAAHGVGLVHLKRTSLRRMAQEFLGFTMDKGQQRSDWGNVELSKEQVQYAALDAWAGYGIIQAMFKRYGGVVGQPKDISEFCQRLLTNRSGKARQRGGEGSSGSKSPPRGGRREGKDKNATTTTSFVRIKRPSDPHSQQQQSPPPQDPPKWNKTLPARRDPLYDNVMMVAPDGEVLSTCSKQRAEWYVSKGLATVVVNEEDGGVAGERGEGGSVGGEEEGEGGSNRMAIRLTFEPSGRRGPDEMYEIVQKENKCVRCGAKERHVRHHVVPSTYRRHFPVNYKAHLAHDILLLCINCHAQCDAVVQERMRALSQAFAAPFASMDNSPIIKDKALDQVRRSARLLMRQGDRLPPDVYAENEQRVKEFLGLDTLDSSSLHLAASVRPVSRNTAFISHGERVVQALLGEGKEGALEAFIREWRAEFLHWLGPHNHLPPMWRVENRVASVCR